MPIPIIAWGAAAVGSAVLGWVFREEISDFFKSEAGQNLVKGIQTALEGSMQPYEKMLNECMDIPSSERRRYLAQVKERLTETEWAILVGHGKGKLHHDLKYTHVVTDLIYVDSSG